jgi:hypothetical protein
MLFELVAGLHAELAERFAEVVVDRARADEQLGRDFLVGGPICREPGDLRFLGGQVVARLDAPLAGVLTGRLQLDPSAPGERLHAELAKQLVSGAQLLARVAAPVLAAQPFAVQKVSAGEL